MLRALPPALAAGFAVFSGASPTAAAPRHHVIAEYPLPQNPALTALTAGPDGNMWVAGYEQISRVTSSGAVTTFNAASLGNSIAVGPDKALWFGAVGSNDLGRITTDGQVSYVAIPPPQGSSNVPLILGIVTGPDGNLWMTDYSNAELIRLTPAGDISYVPLIAGSYPYGIVDGPDGALWAADRAGRLDRVTVDGKVSAISVPGGSAVESVTVGGDGNLWVNNSGAILRVTPVGQVTSFPIPQPQGEAGTVQRVAADRAGNIWFTAWFPYPHEYVGVMTLSGQATLLPHKTRASGAYGIAQGAKSRTMWFTEVFASEVGEAK